MIFICIQNVKSNFKPLNVTSCDCRKHYLYVLHDINKIFHQQNRNTPSTTCSIPQVPHFIVHFIKKPSHCWIGGFGSHMYEKNNSKKRKADKITLTVSGTPQVIANAHKDTRAFVKTLLHINKMSQAGIQGKLSTTLPEST